MVSDYKTDIRMTLTKMLVWHHHGCGGGSGGSGGGGSSGAGGC